MPGLYLLLAPDGTILDHSDEHVQVAMLPREQAVGRHIFDAYPSAPESQQALHESHEYVRRYLKPHTMPLTRYDLLRPAEEGGGFEERYWQITHYPILNQAGKLRYILQRPEDVTERHRARVRQEEVERQLTELKQEADFILENLPVMVAITPASSTTSYFNQKWLEFTGHSTEQLRAGGMLELLHPDDLEHIKAWRDQQLTAPSNAQIEFRIHRHDGVYRWVLTQASSYFGADGQLRMWVSSTIDIHDQKVMVQELLEASQQQAQLVDQVQQAHQLAVSQRSTFYSLFMQAPAMICILRGPEHQFEFVNPAYQAIFPHRQLEGRPVADALPEIVEQGFIDILDGVYRTGETFFGKQVPLMLERGDSTGLQESYFDFTYQQFREHNTVAGIMVFAFEVTDFVLARRKLEALYQNATGSTDTTPATS